MSESESLKNKLEQAFSKPPSPAITSANAASEPINTHERIPDELIVDSEEPIIGKPLVDPDFTKLKCKNTNLVIYWGNRVANGGMRIEDLKARGFRPAKVEDIDGPPQALIKDGHIIRGDLIALVISRRDYLSQQLYNAQQADRRVSKARIKEIGNENLREDLNSVGGVPARHRGKIGMFTP